MNLKKKMIIFLILFSLIPITLLQVYVVGKYSVLQREKITKLIIQNLYQKKNSLNNEIVDYIKILTTIMADSQFTYILNKLIKQNESSSLHLQNTLESMLSQSTYMKEGLFGLLYYERKSNLVLSYNKQLSKPEDIWAALGGIKHAIFIIEENGGVISYLSTISVKNNLDENINLIVVGSRFSDINRTLQRGYIFLLITEKSIHELLNSQRSENSTIFSETMLFTQNKRLVSGFDKSSLGSVYSSPYLSRIVGQDKYLKKEITIERFNWSIITLFREKELFGEIYLFRVFILLVGALSMVLTIFIIRNYIFKVVNSVTTLRSSLKIENDQLLFTVIANDDLDYVNQSFKKMKDLINTLLIDQKVKNLNLLEVQRAKRLAEIRFMEAQINPHFLYNTLNSLNWMALEKSDTIMSKALTELASILRYSISNIEINTTLLEEMLWLEKYLNLQKLRFVDTFNYTIKWDTSMGNFKMYKLLFQPYIENSILHGFSGINYTGQLDIVVSSNNNYELSIIIQDNGRGFDINKITKSTGLKNPASRLKLYYMGDAKLDIQSTIGNGSTISLTIPELKNEITNN